MLKYIFHDGKDDQHMKRSESNLFRPIHRIFYNIKRTHLFFYFGGSHF